jgi:invasion protein IalB
MASVGIIAIAGLAFATGLISTDFLSPRIPATQGDLVENGLKADAVPDIRLGTSFEPDVAASKTSKNSKQRQYGQWTFGCVDASGAEPEKCFTHLAVRDSKRNVALVNWLVGYTKDSKLQMEILTPTDVLIAPGLQLRIGEAPAQRLPYVFCVSAGCLTRINPDAAMLENLRKADMVKLSIATPTGDTVTFSIKIHGIADGLNALAGL